MSQAGSISSSGGGGGGTVIQVNTQLGNATPLAGIIIVNGIDSIENNDNGIITNGGVVGTGTQNLVNVKSTNRQTGSVTTTDATLTTIITFALDVTPGTYYVYGSVQAFNSSTPASGSYSYSGGYRTSGAAATELGIELHDEFEDPAFITADIFLSSSGNNVLIQVQGVAGLSINWNAILEFRQVT